MRMTKEQYRDKLGNNIVNNALPLFPTEQDEEEFHSLFPFRLHCILALSEQQQQQGFSHIISWMPCGTIFKVHDPINFERYILPKMGRLSRFKSFLRQLHMYKFKKIRSIHGAAYAHPYFLRNRGEMCRGILRGEEVKVFSSLSSASASSSSSSPSSSSSSQVTHTKRTRDESEGNKNNKKVKKNRTQHISTDPSCSSHSIPSTDSDTSSSDSGTKRSTTSPQNDNPISTTSTPNCCYLSTNGDCNDKFSYPLLSPPMPSLAFYKIEEERGERIKSDANIASEQKNKNTVSSVYLPPIMVLKDNWISVLNLQNTFPTISSALTNAGITAADLSSPVPAGYPSPTSSSALVLADSCFNYLCRDDNGKNITEYPPEFAGEWKEYSCVKIPPSCSKRPPPSKNDNTRDHHFINSYQQQERQSEDYYYNLSNDNIFENHCNENEDLSLRFHAPPRFLQDSCWDELELQQQQEEEQQQIKEDDIQNEIILTFLL